MAGKDYSYEDIVRSVKNKDYAPVYFLMGEENYFIDRISEYIMSSVLTEEEKEFNMTVLYGAETDISTVINAAKRYPMMSKYQVVVVKEAQSLKKIEDLIYYIQKPSSTTVLVVCYKHGVLDRRKKFTSELEKSCVLFESKRIKEGKLPDFISSYLKRKRVDIEPKASLLMAEFVGTDLSRMAGELEKLIITLPTGKTRITIEQIERNIGISKDYNNFELKEAIITRDVLKANKIVNYFNNNKKNNPIQKTLAVLFGYFQNLMLAYYAPNKSEQGIATFLGLRSAWLAREYIAGMRTYSGVKVMTIIRAIRDCDAKSKGVGNSSMSDGEILKELIYFILH